MTPIHLARFIAAHREALAPPVGNARVFADGDFIIMVVGGPNARKDFHVDPGDELFFQLQGAITLRVMEGGEVRDVPIDEGEMLLLPGGVPHSPQRPAETVGLVIERRRRPGEMDALQWYCDACGELLHEAKFELSDITTQIRSAIESFEADVDARTCRRCGVVLSL